MVFLYKDKSVSGIFFLLLLLIAVHFHFFIAPPQLLINSNDGFISTALHNIQTQTNSTVLFILYLLSVFIQAIRLNYALNNFKMFQQPHQTVAMSYILFSGFFVQWCVLSAAIIANFLVIWIFIKLAQLSSNTNPKTLLFNIGLITSCTILAYHPTYIIVVVVLFALAIVRSFKLVEWVILLMGLAVPFYFLASWLYLTNQFHLIQNYLPDIHFHLPTKHFNYEIGFSSGAILLILIVGLYFNSIHNARMIIQIRKNWSVLLIMLILFLPVSFIFGNSTLEASFLSIIPLSAIAANAYSYPKRLLVSNFLFWLSILITLYINRLLIL
ncbi:MAG TPA: DUF6427 family protein [Chitinophagaceae bacterium]|nr:hypothetical protein [Chitinophagaceae bacterium]MCC6635997.1 hypothetical protein [Chitinophagaceae bacterium]HNJ58374.1 DUF6427 family protein [Chitinophagaceae bacterium]